MQSTHLKALGDRATIVAQRAKVRDEQFELTGGQDEGKNMLPWLQTVLSTPAVIAPCEDFELLFHTASEEVLQVCAVCTVFCSLTVQTLSGFGAVSSADDPESERASHRPVIKAMKRDPEDADVQHFGWYRCYN